jgi:hypothetical protein
VDGRVDTDALFGLDGRRWKDEYESVRDEFEVYKRRQQQQQQDQLQNQQPSPSVVGSGRYLLPEDDQEVVLTLKLKV